ncbi:MAG: FAD-dependent oxidoreductase [Pseudomonadota bacterium]
MDTFAADLATMVRTPLTEDHVRLMRRVGTEMTASAGDLVQEAGKPQEVFLYLQEGELEAVDPATGARYGNATLGPGQFFGELSFMTGAASFISSRATCTSRLLTVPRAAMLQLMADTPEMSDIILSVFAARRRRILESNQAGLTLIGLDTNRDIRRIASFAARNRIPFRTLDDAEGADIAATCQIDTARPAVIVGKHQVIDPPTPRAVAEALGLAVALRKEEVFDVAIVGGGPAGVAAGVYAGAEGLCAVVLEDMAIGGQAGTSSRIENYMGFPTGISGGDLVGRGEVQAIKFGTRFAVPVRAQALRQCSEKLFHVEIDSGETVSARALIVATGVQYRRLPLDRLEALEGAGVYYAATDVEARWCKNTDVVVVGGGNSAGQAAMFLSRYARHVHVLIRGDGVAASMSDYLSSRLERDPRITLHTRTEVTALHGDAHLEAVTIRDKQSGMDWRLPTGALFIMVGAAPNTAWLSGLAELDARGFVKTGAEAGGRSTFETSCKGLFAVGDVRAGSVKRVASSVGEGSVVMSAVWAHINDSAFA